MDEPTRDIDRLEFILEMIRRIEQQLASTPRSALAKSGDQTDLLAFRIGQIGETTNRLSSEICERHAEIEWPRIYRMRNIIIHAYTELVPRLLWDAAVNDIPPLKLACETELARLLSNG